MANYNDLKTGINAVIKTNGRQEISGAALNAQLKNMITELGAGYQYKGVATPATNPGTPDANVFYLASEAGTYTNFGGIVINEGEMCALIWNGTWTKQVTGAATADQVSQLGQDVAQSFIHTKAYTATSTGFKEIPCAFHKGDKVIIKLGGTELHDIYQRPTIGSTTGQVFVYEYNKIITDDGFYFIATVDFESLKIWFETTGTITIERDAISKETSLGDLSQEIKSYLYPSVNKTLLANQFNEIPCAFLKGDKVFIELGENVVISDTYQRPTLGSSAGQQVATKVTTENGYYFIATIDFNSLYIWCGTAGVVTIKRDGIDKTVNTDDLVNKCVTEGKLAFDLTPLKGYVKATPSTIFAGVFPKFADKILQGEYWGTYIFAVEGVEKVKITFSGAASAYGIAFSTKGDTVANFNSGTNSDWWSQYPQTTGSLELNVPSGAKYLALAKEGMSNECELWTFPNYGSVHLNRLYGKKCIFIGDSISTEDNYYWKGLLEAEFNLQYVRGGSGLWPANGGITLMPPQTEPESLTQKSIWYRCAEQRMEGYDFDIISLFGGTNDMVSSARKVGDVDANGDYLNIADIVPFVDDASSFATPSDYNDVWSSDLTYAQCLKGCLEMLHRDFSDKPIIVCSVLPCGGNYGNWIYEHEGSPMNGVIMSERMAIVAMRIVNYYQTKGWNIWGVPFYWGVRTVNSVAAFSNWIINPASVDGVHPNRLCAVRMMNLFKDSLIM